MLAFETFGQDFIGRGPLAGVQFLAGTRGRWWFVAIDEVNLVISAETYETAGWEGRLGRMEAIVETVRVP